MAHPYSLDTSHAQSRWNTLDAFTQGYIEAAMWTLTDDKGHNLDYLGLHDIAEETIEQAITDCASFQAANRTLLDRATDESGRGDESHGHDLWLTRNGHGAGFWDRGYSDAIADPLTDAALACGEMIWYLGDDGLVYGV